MITIFKPKLLCQNKPVTAPHKEVFNIHSKDVLSEPITTFLDKEFNQCSILTAITNSGIIIEILRTKDGQLMQPEQVQLVSDISNFFDKQFQAGTLDGQPCYMNILN